MPKGGLEPPLPCENCALNAARLPVSPLRHLSTIHKLAVFIYVESDPAPERQTCGEYIGKSRKINSCLD